MYAGTKVNWYEVLQPSTNTSGINETLPLFMCVFSADKGTENITDLTYNDFLKMYGKNPDFFKHGQPLIQTHAILRAGGRVLGKRLVAEDSTLANLVIFADVTTEDREEQKKNEKGQLIYLDPDGNETTSPKTGDVDNEKVMITKTYSIIKYTSQSIAGKKSLDEIEAAVKAMTGTAFPIMIIADNGRGASTKKVRITSDYDVSKRLSYMLYSIKDIENSEVIESQRFTLAPDVINTVNGVRKNMALIESTMTQFKAKALQEGIDAFVNKLHETSGYSVETLYTYDLIKAKTVKQEAIPLIEVNTTAEGIFVFDKAAGNDLVNGSNGEFGDAPFAGPEVHSVTDESGNVRYPWTEQAVAFFSGEFNDEIFDVDMHKIDFCCDANYPDDVKHEIVTLANFREDFYYFRDMNLDVNSLVDVQDKADSYPQSPFVGDYLSSYDIIDVYSRKQIPVTMMHGLAPLLVDHYATNIAAPIAGEFNNFVITEAINGTLSYTPRITPTMNQKEILDDLKVNFVNYSSDNLLTVQSTYTSQDHWGPLSYASNVIVTQMLIKDIRRYTPKIRFMLVDDSDFSKYKVLVTDNVIDRYKSFFKSVDLRYTRDDEMIANKIFNASLYCYYKDFAQGEIFDVFAMEGSPDNNPVESITNATAI